MSNIVCCRRQLLCIICCLCLLAPVAQCAHAEDSLSLFSAMTSDLFDTGTEYSVDSTKPMVALTFDDGPSEYTSQILDLLTQYGGRATFFMIGNRVAKHKEVVQQVVEQGSEIASHTWSHPDLNTLDEAGVRAQLSKSVNTLEYVGGQPIRLMRPPYGNQNETVRAACRSSGLSIITWSIDTRDWRTRDAQATYDAIMQDVQHGSIVLCHDIYPSTAEAMAKVIPALIQQGYQLVTVSELFEASGKTLHSGSVYNRFKPAE